MSVLKENVEKIFKELLTLENFEKNDRFISYYFNSFNNRIKYELTFRLDENVKPYEDTPDLHVIFKLSDNSCEHAIDSIVEKYQKWGLNSINLNKYLYKNLSFYVGSDFCHCGRISYNYNPYCNNCMLTKKLFDDPCVICLEPLIDKDFYYKNCCDKCTTKVHTRCYYKNKEKCPICRD